MTLWRSGDGRLKWRLKAEPDDARPLYGLDRLAARPAAPVLLVEGEKTADAAGRIFPEFVVMTWPGGANAIAKVDFAPLNGRRVVVWPDADPPGRKAAAAAVRALAAIGAVAAVVKVPEYLPKGWDLADEWPASFNEINARASLSSVETEAVGAIGSNVNWPPGYRMEQGGLWFDTVKDETVTPAWISAPFEVLGLGRSLEGGEWSVVIRFRDADGRIKTRPVSRSRLASGGGEVRGELAGLGLVVDSSRSRGERFANALMRLDCTQRIQLVSATGWSGDRFVLPNQIVGSAAGDEVMFTGESPALNYGRKGTLDAWRTAIAAKAAGNDLLALAISLAFTGPLLRLLDLDGGGVHFRGPSSCGKTTLAQAAGSVWGGGGPLGFAQSWRSTANALEMLASGHNDSLLVLDELALVSPDEAGAAAYSLASGQSKARSRADGSLRQRTEWRIAIFSTGEISLADHIRASKRNERPMAGQELRLLDLSADAGRNMGVWQDLHGAEDGAALSEAIRAAAAADFGHAGPAFLEALTANRAVAITLARRVLEVFVQRVRREGDTGQAHRAAVRFGAIAAAGELAAEFGVTGWPRGLASDAARRLYDRWATRFGRNRSHEALAVLKRIQEIITTERSGFASAKAFDEDEASGLVGDRAGEARSLVTYGYRRFVEGRVQYLFTTAGFERALKGHNASEAARVIDAEAFLERGSDPARLQQKVSAQGQKIWVYVVKGELAEADFTGVDHAAV